MQPQENVGTPRRSLDVEDYIDILRRHKAWIFGPAFAGLVLAVVAAFLWPDTYVSSAVVRLVPPQVPERYVPLNITSDLQGRINNMTQVVLNRASLTTVINQYGLYKKELSRVPLDDVIERMRASDIKIGPVQNVINTGNARDQVPAFSIGFEYNDRFVAQKVTTDLVTRLITESLNETSAESQMTTEFLQSQWQTAKKKLEDIDQKLSDFRSRNLGRLPDQQQQNIQQLNSMETQLLSVQASVGRVNQDRMLLENRLRINQDQLAAIKTPDMQDIAAQQQNARLLAKDKEISDLEGGIARMRETYKDTYPDVQHALALLATARREREAILKEDASKTKIDMPLLRANPEYERNRRALEANIREIQGAIQAKDLESEDLQKEGKRINAQMKVIGDRIEATPVGQKEYVELLRDEALARQDYDEADRKLGLSQQSTQIQQRQQGERLELLDPANLPQTPTKPKRLMIVGVGFAAGIGLGLFLAGLREVKDTSLKNLKDVRAYTSLPVLGSIPLLENDSVVRRRRRLGWLAWSTACLVGVVIMSGSVVYYYATKV